MKTTLVFLLLIPSLVYAQHSGEYSSAGGGIYFNDEHDNVTTTSSVFAGQFVKCKVSQGDTYDFSTCGANWNVALTLIAHDTKGRLLASDDDGCGTTHGPAVIHWTSDFTGIVCVLLDAVDEPFAGELFTTITILRTADNSTTTDDMKMNSALIENVYPNPSAGDFNVRVNNAAAQQLTFNVTDLNGRTVLRQYVHIAEGVFTFRLYTNELPSGIYVLTVVQRNGRCLLRQELSKQ